ncbi:MAG: NAD-dependent epimerase/dehydratase family protein [Chitinispirillaceae bacterium]|nr:NAD-dependent epimerase/dehydratase family protein [Chitinispirillaceae bacterium]
MTQDTPQRALITGSNGFVGEWLVDHLNAKRYEVHGIDLQEQSNYPSVAYHHIDLLDTAATAALVTDLQPEIIFHLAAVSYLPDADRSPRQSIDINIAGTMAVLDAVKVGAPAARILLVGSAKEYSDSILSDGVTEDTPPRPTNFYGISKYACELIGLQYCRQFGIDIRCTRSFNHTGPGQSHRFVCSDWARQVAAISLKLAEPFVTVGDLNATIDFSDVRDVVNAYYLILEKGKPGEVYNICSGSGVDLSWILGYLCDKTPIPVAVQHINGKNRPYKSNVKMIGSHRKVTGHTGWQPSIPLQRTLDELYEWWMGELGKGSQESGVWS